MTASGGIKKKKSARRPGYAADADAAASGSPAAAPPPYDEAVPPAPALPVPSAAEGTGSRPGTVPAYAASAAAPAAAPASSSAFAFMSAAAAPGGADAPAQLSRGSSQSSLARSSVASGAYGRSQASEGDSIYAQPHSAAVVAGRSELAPEAHAAAGGEPLHATASICGTPATQGGGGIYDTHTTQGGGSIYDTPAAQGGGGIYDTPDTQGGDIIYSARAAAGASSLGGSISQEPPADSVRRAAPQNDAALGWSAQEGADHPGQNGSKGYTGAAPAAIPRGAPLHTGAGEGAGAGPANREDAECAPAEPTTPGPGARAGAEEEAAVEGARRALAEQQRQLRADREALVGRVAENRRRAVAAAAAQAAAQEREDYESAERLVAEADALAAEGAALQDAAARVSQRGEQLDRERGALLQRRLACAAGRARALEAEAGRAEDAARAAEAAAADADEAEEEALAEEMRGAPLPQTLTPLAGVQARPRVGEWR